MFDHTMMEYSKGEQAIHDSKECSTEQPMYHSMGHLMEI
jgi:hypothetical protein